MFEPAAPKITLARLIHAREGLDGFFSKGEWDEKLVELRA
jgi:hypothetical protein